MSLEALRADIEGISPMNEREVLSIEKTLDRLTWPETPSTKRRTSIT